MSSVSDTLFQTFNTAVVAEAAKLGFGFVALRLVLFGSACSACVHEVK
jgi:hypothetical protein